MTTGLLQRCSSSAALGSRGPSGRCGRQSVPASVLRRRAAHGGRRGPCTPRANWVTDALFKGKEEKALDAFAKSDAGKRAAEHAAKGGGFDDIIAFGRKEVVEAHVPGSGHLIDSSTRILIATLVNRVVDVPILNEATEQVIAVKVVDLIADFLEGELERAGIAAFFADVRGMSEVGASRCETS